ncbi:DUF2326 domain-containing protein [Candidatus Parcubacteria bacterium]|nr:DUF2326 domain-containing protein [Candidatus Parcubacteria bacterium]
MKLSKIYANNQKFKSIIFNEGFNVIYGNIDNEINQDTRKVQEHNIGKTSLVYLIDFLLLKGVNKKNFFGKHNKKFSDWVFFLEIKLNSREYLTIRRAVNPNTKISFKKHFSKDQNYSDETNWDYSDLLMNAEEQKKTPRHILETKYLQFDVNTKFNYRNFLSHLLRTQNDYQDVFKLNKFRGKDKDWKPSLFKLLGFDATILQTKYELDSEIKSDKEFIKKLEEQGDSDEIYKIKAAIEAKEVEKNEFKKEIDNFNFYKKEKNISFDLVKNIENEISRLNKENYVLSYNIEQIQKSLDSENMPSIQVNEIKKIFEEATIFFPDNLSKDYQDVLNFSQQITKERKKYLKEELSELQGKQKKTDKKLKELNKQRGKNLSFLKEKDSFVKYKKYQEELIKIEGDIIVYQQKLEGAKTIENYQKSIEDIKNKITELTVLIKEEINKDNINYRSIKEIFREIYKKTFEYTANLVVQQNKQGNIDFDTIVLNISKDLTGKQDGYTSTKVLCTSFVLAILVHYSAKSFFRFAYHDGILESWGDNHKIHFIELIRDYCDKYGIQYTISLIKSDIPSGFKLQDKEIIRTLSKGDELFGFEF